MLDRLLKMIADVALRHCAAFGERHERGVPALVCGELHCKIYHADLRAVAVSDDDLIAFPYKIDDGSGGIAYKLKLLLGVFSSAFPPSATTILSAIFLLISMLRTSQP